MRFTIYLEPEELSYCLPKVAVNPSIFRTILCKEWVYDKLGYNPPALTIVLALEPSDGSVCLSALKHGDMWVDKEHEYTYPAFTDIVERMQRKYGVSLVHAKMEVGVDGA